MKKQISILDTLNYSQRNIAEVILNKVERALKSNNEEPIENRIFSIKGAARNWEIIPYNSACSRA